MALVERELARHRANLERSLNASDQSDREAARLSIVKGADGVTRGLKADLARAERRFKWAEETFQRLRQGVDPATDYRSGHAAHPINPDAQAAPVSEPASPEPPPPTTPTPAGAHPPESSASESPPPSVPEGCSEEDAEMLRIAGGAIRGLFRPSGAAMPPTDEPTDGPGPVLPG